MRVEVPCRMEKHHLTLLRPDLKVKMATLRALIDARPLHVKRHYFLLFRSDNLIRLLAAKDPFVR